MSRSPRHLKRNQFRLKKHLLVCERLEARHLLANDLGVGLKVIDDLTPQEKAMTALEDNLSNMAATHYYEVDGQPVGMVIHPAKMALKVSPGVTSEALNQLGLQFERELTAGYSLYESASGSAIDVNALTAAGIVQGTLPAFYAQKTHSDAVLFDELIVSLKPGVTAAAYFTGNATFSAYRPLLGTNDQFVATVAAGTGPAALAVANAIDNDPRLQFVSPNFYQSWQTYYTPNDPRFTNQWHLNNTGQGGGLVDADVDAPEAWNVIQGGSPSLVIGVVDTPVAVNHPDLNIWVNPGEFPDGEDNDGNGYIDDMNGWNFFTNTSNTAPEVANDNHGTSVAGVAAARGDNALGVVGASYGSRILAAPIFRNNGATNDANIAAALYYAAGRKADGSGTFAAADMVNNSWGGGANSAAINAALTWGTTLGRQGKGAAYLFATGNGFATVTQPALQSAVIPGVYAIGASNFLDTRANYSNIGPEVDMVAPSNDLRPGYLAIDTTDRLGADGYDPGDYTGTGANGFGGTSSATPLTTGIAALTLARAESLGLNLTPAQLRSYMRMQTDLIGGVEYDPVTGKNIEFGFGKINAFSSVSNLNKPEISVLSSTLETQSGGTLSVGSVFIDEFKDATFRIRNQGTQALVLNSLNIGPGDFSLIAALGATTLQMGEWTTFTVRFAPTAGGLRTQTVTITSNDASEGSFTFTLSGLSIIPTVAGTLFEDWDGDNVMDPFDNPLPSQFVFADTNNNGTLDITPTSFVQSTSIPLVDAGLATSTLSVSGVGAPIFDLNVRINATHTWVSDLVITLVSPTGTRVILAANVGTNTDHFTNTVFDDEATVPIASGVAPRTGSFKPAEPLSAFDGQVPDGTWTIEFEDQADFDTGSLLNWELVISTAEPATQTRANGKYAIVDLPVGTYTVRTALPPGWTSASTYPINVTSPTDSFRPRDFAVAKNDRFYSFAFNDFDTDGVWDENETAATGRMMLEDLNGNGTQEVGPVTTFTNSTALTIPDNSTVTSTLSVSGISGVVSDINVRLNINMTFDSDLDVFLIGPDGTRVELFTDVGGAGVNFTNTVLDDQAATSIVDSAAPFTGTFRPEGSLATFNTKMPNGTWTLELSDDTFLDVGTLTTWSIIISGGEAVVPMADSGLLAMDMVIPGTQSVKLMPLAGWRYTQPSTGSRTVSVAGTPVFDQRFGTRLANAAPTVNVPTATVSGSEGGTLTNSGTWTDPDFGDVISFTASVGTITNDQLGNWNWSLNTTDNAGSTSVTITANDGQGGTSSKTFDYSVANVNPTVAASSGSVSGNVQTTITNSGTWGDVPADTVTLTASAGTIVKNANGTWNWSITPSLAIAGQTITITATDEDGGSSTTSFTLAAFTTIPATNAYYKGSFYSAGGTNVPAALDTSKSLLRAGASTAATSFANVTNYSKGINGVVVDIAGLTATSLTAADFTFKMSPVGAFDEGANPPSSWANAPAPTSITVAPATPGPNSSRIKIEWPDNAIQDRWLQIRVLPTANTGLQSAATYYLGNLRGDIDGITVGGLFLVQNADLSAALPVGGVGTVTSLRDVDKNGFILNSDFVIIRSGINANLSLRAITIPAAGSAQEARVQPTLKASTKLTSALAPQVISPASALASLSQSPLSAGTGIVQVSSTGLSGQAATAASSTAQAKLATATPAVTSAAKKTQAVDAVFEQLWSAKAQPSL